ncbi:MAG: hypothetical protein ABSG15_01215 [FCB group bacterium]
MKILFCLPIALILSSCGTTQTSIPPVPLRHGEYEYRFGIGYSFNDFNGLSLQANFYKGISDRDIIGMSLNNFLFPCHFAYAHCWMDKSNTSGANLQVNLGNFLRLEFNPTFEIDAAYTNYFSNVSQSFKIGLGYFYHPFLYKTQKYENINRFTPVIGYLLQLNALQFEAGLYFGLTEHYIDYYNPIINIDKDNNFEKYRIPHDSIISIIDTTGYRNWRGREWLIKLKDSSIIKISEFDDYVDCIGCGYFRIMESKYMADSGSNIYWFNRNYIELNLNKIFKDYYDGKDFIIKEDSGLLEKKKSKIRKIWDDINFGIGYRYRKEWK